MKLYIAIGLTALLLVSMLIFNLQSGYFDSRKPHRPVYWESASSGVPPDPEYSEDPGTDSPIDPGFPSITLDNFEISDRDETVAFSCDELTIGLSCPQMMSMVRGKGLKDLNPFSARIRKPRITFREEDVVLAFQEVFVKFDGHIDHEIFLDPSARLPEKDLRLEVMFTGFEISVPEDASGTVSAHGRTLEALKSNKGSLVINFNPATRMLEIEELTLTTPLASLSYRAGVKYVGTRLVDFRPLKLTGEIDFRLASPGFDWGDRNVFGRYRMKKAMVRGASEMEFDTFGEVSDFQGNGKLLVEGFRAEFSEELKREMDWPDPDELGGLELDGLEIEEFKCSYDLKNGRMKIFDTNLKTPLVEARFEAHVSIDERDPDDSVINKASLVLNILNRDLVKLLAETEKEMGQALPRMGRQVVLDFHGTLGDPKIRGLDF